MKRFTVIKISCGYFGEEPKVEFRGHFDELEDIERVVGSDIYGHYLIHNVTGVIHPWGTTRKLWKESAL